jgi:hypothetical protein
MVPCALATPVPAINTAAAADNNNRLFIYISSHCTARVTTKGGV